MLQTIVSSQIDRPPGVRRFTRADFFRSNPDRWGNDSPGQGKCATHIGRLPRPYRASRSGSARYTESCRSRSRSTLLPDLSWPGLWSSARDTSPLAQICARVDYVNGLQENLKGQEAASEEVR